MDYNVIYIGEEPDFKEFHVYCAVDPINFTHAVEIQKYSFFIRFQHGRYKKTSGIATHKNRPSLEKNFIKKNCPGHEKCHGSFLN